MIKEVKEEIMMWGMPVRNKWRKESNPARENQIPVMIMGQRKAS